MQRLPGHDGQVQLRGEIICDNGCYATDSLLAPAGPEVGITIGLN